MRSFFSVFVAVATAALAAAPVALAIPQPGLAGHALSSTSSVQGSLDYGDFTLKGGEYVDVYTYRATAGETVTFTLESSAYDTWLSVSGPGGTYLYNDDYSGTNSSVTLYAATAGDYTIYASSYVAGSTGSYNLRVNGAAASAPPVTSGTQVQVMAGRASVQTLHGNVTGSISYSEATSGECRGYFAPNVSATLQVTGNTTVRIHAESTTDTTLFVTGGTIDSWYLCNDDDYGNLNPLVDTVLAPGTYQVYVGTYGQNAAANYSLVIENW